MDRSIPKMPAKAAQMPHNPLYAQSGKCKNPPIAGVNLNYAVILGTFLVKFVLLATFLPFRERPARPYTDCLRSSLVV